MSTKCCNAEEERDEFGFTGNQRHALVEFWQTRLQDNLEIHGKNIFIKFLQDFREYYKFWSVPDEPYIHVEDLPLHGQVVMFSLDRMIRDLSTSPDAYLKTVKKLVEKHVKFTAPMLAMQRYTYTITRYLERTFTQDLLPEVRDGLRLFFGVLHDQFVIAQKTKIENNVEELKS